MFLFPWLDCGIDISVFEKIDFLDHKQFLPFSAPWKGAFLGSQVKFRPHSGGVEYSTSIKIFIFKKPNVSAFKCRVSRFFPTITDKKPPLRRKKCEKNHPDEPFDMRVSKRGFLGAENAKNGSRDKKAIFSKSKISIHQSNHWKRNIKSMLVRSHKRFRTTWGVSEIMMKFQFLPSTNIFLWDFPREVFFGRAKNRKFWIIAEITQVVLKCF